MAVMALHLAAIETTNCFKFIVKYNFNNYLFKLYLFNDLEIRYIFNVYND